MRYVKVTAEFRKRMQTLIEEPLSLPTLALLSPVSPLSKLVLDGAGFARRPRRITVEVDGKRIWSAKCGRHGSTDDGGSSRPSGPITPVVLWGDVAKRCGFEFTEEKLAANRAAWELLHNAPDTWADEWADDVVTEAGSLRPALQPTSPPAETPAPIRPCPSPRFGDIPRPEGFVYRPTESWREVRPSAAGPGVDYAFLSAR